jgi:hypothetical protein
VTAEPIEPDDPNGESTPARSTEPILPAHPFAVALSARAEVGLTLSALTQRLWWPDDGEEIRTQWKDFRRYAGDEVSADLTAARARIALEHIGFSAWRGVHVVDLRSSRLIQARKGYLDQMWPDRFPEDT